MATLNIILVLGIGIGMIGVLISLIAGLFAMTGNDEASRIRSNAMMRFRVGFQFLTLVCGVLFIALNLMQG